MLETGLVWFAVAIPVAMSMEWWARWMHDRAWHGPLWSLHRSHHKPSGPVELNDVFPVLHAPFAAALMIQRAAYAGEFWSEVAFGVGLGATLFGLAYVVVHDGFVHGRLPVAFLGRIPALVRIREAHALHHRHGREPYGLFLGATEVERARQRGDLPPG